MRQIRRSQIAFAYLISFPQYLFFVHMGIGQVNGVFLKAKSLDSSDTMDL